MESANIEHLIQEIVKEANELKNLHTNEKNARVNYACIFAQNQIEFDKFLKDAEQIGNVIKQTETGPLFEIKPLNTISGTLRLLKIRMPDKTRTEKGDADFTISNYNEFKKNHLSKHGFKLIQRTNYEMIELGFVV